MSALDYLSSHEVHDSESLCTYIEQQTGTPYATWKDKMILKKKCKEFFERYPHCDYTTLAKVADWSKRKRKRYSNVWQVIDAFRYAYRDGALPEVDRPRLDVPLEEAIEEALRVETDNMWRRRLICTENVQTRKEVLDNWQTQRKPLLTAL